MFHLEVRNNIGAGTSIPQGIRRLLVITGV
jgi:hypothetical protein